MADTDLPPVEPGQPRWTRLAVLGLLLEAGGLLIIFFGGLTWGSSFEPFFAVLAAVPLIAAYLMWRFGTSAKAVGAFIGLALGGLMSFAIFGLFVPNSFFDFGPAVLIIPGGILAVAGGIGAIVAGRRGHRTEAAEGGERRGIRIAVGAAAVLLVVSGILTFLSKSTVVDSSAASVRVDMRDTKFAHRQYTADGGATVLIVNEDPFFHTFTVDALDVDEGFTLGQSRLIQIPARPGTYVLYCKVHTSNSKDPSPSDMAATLIVG